MRSIPVRTESANYSVFVQPRLLETLANRIRSADAKKHSTFVVTSPNIWKLWGKPFLASFSAQNVSPKVMFVPAGERYKRLSTIERLADEMVQAGAKRDALLIAFGGGVIGDMTGFLAAIYMRGIPYIQVPTTYLSQIDSSVGGKTGVNLRSGKNLIGSFHHPVAVFCDPAILRTLPAPELRAGLVESIKAAVLGDARYFGWLERNLDRLLAGDQAALTQAIETSIRIKAKIVGADERESGMRMLLNLGHTVGHAIEAATNYRSLLHGEAIAWGMIAALRVATTRKALTPAQSSRIEDMLFRLGPFPRFSSTSKTLAERTSADKKHLQTAQRFVLPIAIGKAVVVENVQREELLAAIQAMLRTMKERGV